MNLAACGGLPHVPERGIWFRAIGLQHMVSPLSVLHTKPVASRFSPGYLLPPRRQYALAYLTEDPQTALYEIGSMLGTPLLPGRALSNGKLTPVILNVHVDLKRVVDLCDDKNQAALAATAQELTGDWMGYQHRRPGLTQLAGPTGLAPTQELGQELRRFGFEALRTISAKVSTNRNLVVFPDNLRKGSSISFIHPDGVTPPVVLAG